MGQSGREIWGRLSASHRRAEHWSKSDDDTVTVKVKDSRTELLHLGQLEHDLVDVLNRMSFKGKLEPFWTRH